MNLRDYIHTDPEVLLGKPVVKGTRLSVECILGLFAQGWTQQQVLENYPRLTPESLRAVSAFAEVVVTLSVEEFNGFVKRQLEEIDSYSNDRHRRILLLALLDHLATFAFPKEDENKRRFVKLIDAYSGWEDKDRVSVVILDQRLRMTDTASCLDLRKEVSDRMARLQPPRVYRPDEIDPLRTDLAGFGELEQGMIDRCRHPSILWDVRNFAVHNFWPILGGSLDMKSPYYLWNNDWHLAIPWNNDWHFAIPTKFLSSLAHDCAASLATLFNDNPDAFNYAYWCIATLSPLSSSEV